MKTLAIFDPALCCSSGVCGPSVDPELVRVQADLEWLKKQGVAVERYNLAQQPAVFAENEKVKAMLTESGTDALPVLLLEGQLVASRFYPTREQFAQLCGLSIAETDCACGSGGCC
ncbi:MAG: arsenite efflux transporter metallochaperone ArsD [Kiritimatiellia bacterium]